MLLRLQRQQGVHAGDGSDVGLLQQRLKRLHRVDHAKQFEFSFMQPRLARGVMEVRHVSLPGVVDQHVHGTKAHLNGIREGLHLVSVQHVAAIRENLPAGVFVMQRGMGAGEAIRIAATEGHFCPLAQQQA